MIILGNGRDVQGAQLAGADRVLDQTSSVARPRPGTGRTEAGPAGVARWPRRAVGLSAPAGPRRIATSARGSRPVRLTRTPDAERYQRRSRAPASASVCQPPRSGRSEWRPSDRSGSWRRTTPSQRRRSYTLDADDTTVGCDLVSAYGLSTGPSQRRDGDRQPYAPKPCLWRPMTSTWASQPRMGRSVARRLLRGPGGRGGRLPRPSCPGSAGVTGAAQFDVVTVGTIPAAITAACTARTESRTALPARPCSATALARLRAARR